jgi:hypothetical protein
LQLGFEFINWKDNLDAIEQAELSSIQDFKQEKNIAKKMKNAMSSINLKKEIIDNIVMNNTINENLLILEGGAAGHMKHPFEDNNLTFRDFKELINRSLTGELNKEGPVSEKIDGQNIMIS